ncbi:transposase [Sphingobacterium bovisgrunnientis]|uniref:transposase n=1 Tax=Sphingobacterium bovisgrunnientis TaxID=1874697 RepID=UPI001F038BBC|nr:transposase [Sphingobacterium bovisgrunnientis]
MEYEDGIVEPVFGAFYATSAYAGLHFFYFREDVDYPVKQELINLSEDQENFVLKDNNLLVIKHSPEFKTNKQPYGPTHRILASLFSRERLGFILRKQGLSYEPEVLSNGDTIKQLLARSRHLLFKHPSRWTESQKHRAELLFIRFPKLRQAYDLGIALGDIFTKCKDKTLAFTKLGLWHNKVENAGIISFESVAKSIAAHHPEILHYFDNRSTNASAESPNFG